MLAEIPAFNTEIARRLYALSCEGYVLKCTWVSMESSVMHIFIIIYKIGEFWFVYEFRIKRKYYNVYV
jgi:hypothetical protein